MKSMMEHIPYPRGNALTRSFDRVPAWLVQTVVATAISGLIAWTTWSTAATIKHETRIAVVETRTNGIDKSLDEIKDGQKEMNRKLDVMIESRHGR